jgi:teichuronic acid biosynthesis glycosyltransferase TuaG
MNGLVSIITPAYNAQSFIAQTIESVIAQTYQNWELIIVNDCSTDRTSQIMQKYAEQDRRIRLVHASKNNGVAATRNLALAAAHGKYIAFLDSDDIWAPEKLEKQISFMMKNDYAFTFTSYQLIDETGQELNRFVFARPKMTYKDVLKNTLIGCLTVMVDRDKVGSFSMPLIAHTEDTMTWVDILKRGFIAYGIPDILASYRISARSMTSNKVSAAKLQWRTYRNYCGYGVLKSIYYFCCYAANAVTKVKTK